MTTGVLFPFSPLEGFSGPGWDRRAMPTRDWFAPTLADVKHEAAEPFENEGQNQTRERANEPPAQNTQDLPTLNRFASAC
ncbi:MAG: hypothetical protein M3Y81_16045 [Chloroflexota bacterium]|nr:hypothetical protein [Chloroflexota bacterium]